MSNLSTYKICDMPTSTFQPEALYISWVFLYNMLVCDSMKEMGSNPFTLDFCDSQIFTKMVEYTSVGSSMTFEHTNLLLLWGGFFPFPLIVIQSWYWVEDGYLASTRYLYTSLVWLFEFIKNCQFRLLNYFTIRKLLAPIL